MTSQDNQHNTGNFLYLLDHEEYRSYNISIARRLGSVNAAIFLSELINRHRYHEGKKELTTAPDGSGGWFYYTHEKGTERLCLSRHEQDHAVKLLEAYDLVTKKTFGLPNKKHFKLNIKELEKFLTESPLQPVCKKTATGLSKTANCTYIEEHYRRSLHAGGVVSDHQTSTNANAYKISSASQLNTSTPTSLQPQENKPSQNSVGSADLDDFADTGLSSASIDDCVSSFGLEVVNAATEVLKQKLADPKYVVRNIQRIFIGICKKEDDPIKTLIRRNMATMRKAVEINPWLDVTIGGDYVKFNGTSKVLSFNLNSEEFVKKLKAIMTLLAKH